ncbi:APC family permease [Nocardioides sp. GY 10127]|uniref:APC family permease n=1 Tax=Nocardioides sp. GY 10127 TaxID=2569762 RepID=UPI0010A93736|nr:APC family permease [Nocardioides sp. GY 10127]TIC79127.1 APC family permease [Nocardioides sp. GY 10127]
MTDLSTGPTPGSPAVAPAPDAHGAAGLQGGLGTGGLVLTVLGYLAPLATGASLIPLLIGYGNGLGSPLVLLLVGALFLVFAVGYTAMVRHVENPGAFYAFITAGLGRRVGLGSAFMTTVFYVLIAFGFYLFGGAMASATAQSIFGVDVPWQVFALGFLALVTAFTYRGVDFNAKVVGVVVAVEFALLLVFDLVTVVRGGSEGLPTQTFSWDAFTSGPVALSLLFVFGLFLGFETTSIFREEVKDPGRTVPRATYAVVVILTLLYGFTTWAVIAALGTGDAVLTAATDPGTAFDVAIGSMLGGTVSNLVALLIITSLVASQLSVANATTRYVYSLGVDGVLPAGLGAVHPRLGSPARASLLTNGLIGLCLVLAMLTGGDPLAVYTVTGGTAMLAFQVMLLLVSFSVVVYFARHREHGAHPLRVFVAPAVTIVALLALTVYTAQNLTLLAGTDTALIAAVLGSLAVALVIGFVLAGWLAQRRPHVFARIGRQ